MTTKGREIEIGTAGEHLVCADLILRGHRAYMVSAGLPYDVVIDCGNVLIRVAVKSTQKAKPRPKRENFRNVYQFGVTRSRRRSTGKTDARAYTAADTDVMAFVGLDENLIAYCHISECASTMQFDPPGTVPPVSRRGMIPGRTRKTFAQFSLVRALDVHAGRVKPLPLKGRRP